MNPDEYRRLFEIEAHHWWYRGMRAISLPLLAAALGPPRPRRLLDVGCGSGLNLVHLARLGQAVGVDIAAEAIDACRRRGVTAERAAAEQLPFADGTFDAVTCFDVLYHRRILDDAAAVREMARVLTSGGVLLVRVPALPMLARAHDREVHTRHRYTRGEVVRLVEQAGLRVVRATYCNTLLLPLVAARSALDRVVRVGVSDLTALPGPLDRMLGACLAAEGRLLRWTALPIGASVLAVAKKA